MVYVHLPELKINKKILLLILVKKRDQQKYGKKIKNLK